LKQPVRTKQAFTMLNLPETSWEERPITLVCYSRVSHNQQLHQSLTVLCCQVILKE